MEITTRYAASKAFRIASQTIYESGYVDTQVTTAMMGLHKDDRGLSALTCKDKHDKAANEFLRYVATTAQEPEPKEELYGLQFLHGDDAQLLQMEAEGKTQKQMADAVGIQQAGVSRALASAHQRHAFVSSECGFPWFLLSEVFFELGVEVLCPDWPTSKIVRSLLTGGWARLLLQNQKRKRPLVRLLNQVIRALRATKEKAEISLADLIKSHLKKPSTFTPARVIKPNPMLWWFNSGRTAPELLRLRNAPPKRRNIRRSPEMSPDERTTMFAMHRGRWHVPALRSAEDDPARVEFLEELRRKRLAKAKPEGWPDEEMIPTSIIEPDEPVQEAA